MSTIIEAIAPAPYVTIPLAATITGFTEKAIRHKIDGGIWLEGREYMRGPDNRIYISMKGYAKWVERGSKSGRGQSASPSRSTASSTEKP